MAHIYYQKGSIFDSTAQVIVNTVNCEGYMGRGLALAFKQKYPKMFSVYQKECKTGRLSVGKPTLYRDSTPWILNFPTKINWRANSKLEYLEKGLKYFVANYKNAAIQSIAFPKLGTQNGKLSWADVGPLMVKYLSQTDIDVFIYIVDGDIEYQVENNISHQSSESLGGNALNDIWKQFNEIALSHDRLHKEIRLNLKDAKKVATRRLCNEFKSQADVLSIEGLARTSIKKIQEYINTQRYDDTLLDLLSENDVSQQKIDKEDQLLKSTKNEEASLVSLFTSQEIAS